MNARVAYSEAASLIAIAATNPPQHFAIMASADSDATPSPTLAASSSQSHPSVVPSSAILDEIVDVEIASSGVFKYILVRVTDETAGIAKVIVRGNREAGYHADILDAFKSSVSSDLSAALSISMQGGGRINHDPDSKTISIYGYSVDFGRAQHSTTKDMLIKAYPEYDPSSITWTNDGY